MKVSPHTWAVLGAAFWMACGNGLPGNQAVQSRIELAQVASCGALEKYIEDTAVLQMRSRLEQYKQGVPIIWDRGDVVMDAGGEAPPAGPAGPSAYTTTNTQVAGVDEADFVKNDGTRIFVLSGNTLYLNRSWPPQALQTVATVPIEGWPQEMFLDSANQVVVFSAVYTPLPADPADSPQGAPCSAMHCGYYYSNTLKLTLVDVTALEAPRVTFEYYLPGYYVSSRRIGSSVRLVTSDSFRWPAGVRWWVDGNIPYNDKAALARAFDALMAQNEHLIRSQSLEAWLPKSYYKAADGSLVHVSYNCSEFHLTNVPSRLGFTSVSTLDLTPATVSAQGRPPITRTTVVAETGEIYSSPTALYLASPHWWWWPEPGQTEHTYLHKFDLTSPSHAVYVASGGVPGHIVDQFSLDEKDGYLRVATTIRTRVQDIFSPWGRVETTNRLFVLAERQGQLEVVGRTQEVAPGMSIYGARFLGNRAFISTFRQVDPLVSFDLSNPTHPVAVGELHVPGFSTYLHPIDDNHLLAIGEYVPEPPADWRARSLQLSIFDVSDLAHPQQTFTRTVGTAYGWSEAMYDHKAFNYFPQRKLLAVPFSDWLPAPDGSWSWSSFITDLRVFSIDSATGITPKGALSMSDVYQTSSSHDWTYYWTPNVRRSVMADNFVYAISDGGIRVADVDALGTPLATALFSRAQE